MSSIKRSHGLWFFSFLWCLACSVSSAVLSATSSLPAPGASTIILASTTSTEQSGLFGYLLPLAEKSLGIKIRLVAVGTGQALDIARRGDADLVLVHDRRAEDRALAEGSLIERHFVMYNDFVLVGPRADPAQVASTKDVVQAFSRIFERRANFVSRGDQSGTHMAELRFWGATGLKPLKLGAMDRSWYAETGSGMGASLNVASARNAYLLVDRASWLSFKNRADLTVLLQGDARLLNPYSVLLVNPAKHPHVKQEAARQMAQWLISSQGQEAIASFQIQGETLFRTDGRASFR